MQPRRDAEEEEPLLADRQPSDGDDNEQEIQEALETSGVAPHEGDNAQASSQHDGEQGWTSKLCLALDAFRNLATACLFWLGSCPIPGSAPDVEEGDIGTGMRHDQQRHRDGENQIEEQSKRCIKYSWKALEFEMAFGMYLVSAAASTGNKALVVLAFVALLIATSADFISCKFNLKWGRA